MGDALAVYFKDDGCPGKAKTTPPCCFFFKDDRCCLGIQNNNNTNSQCALDGCVSPHPPRARSNKQTPNPKPRTINPEPSLMALYDKKLYPTYRFGPLLLAALALFFFSIFNLFQPSLIFVQPRLNLRFAYDQFFHFHFLKYFLLFFSFLQFLFFLLLSCHFLRLVHLFFSILCCFFMFYTFHMFFIFSFFFKHFFGPSRGVPFWASFPFFLLSFSLPFFVFSLAFIFFPDG